MCLKLVKSSVITQIFLEVVEEESKSEVTTNQPSDAESSQSASREGSLFIIYLCSFKCFRLVIDARICLKNGGIPN